MVSTEKENLITETKLNVDKILKRSSLQQEDAIKRQTRSHARAPLRTAEADSSLPASGLLQLMPNAFRKPDNLKEP